MTKPLVNKIGIFIDGMYFSLVGQYYQNDNPLKRHLDQKIFLEFIQTKVASTLQLKPKNTRIDICNMYMGLPPEQTVEKTSWQERSLAEVGIKLNVFPLKPLPDGTFKEQGVDATLTFEIGLAVKNLDTVVIITGDGDFIATMDRVKELNKKTFLFYWNITQTKNQKIFTNSELIGTVEHSVDMRYEIENGIACHDRKIEKIFGIEHVEIPPAKGVGTEEVHLGIITDRKNMSGFIRPLLGGKPIHFLKRDTKGAPFNKFLEKKMVQFVLEKKNEGAKKEPVLVATNVTLQE